MLKLPISFCLGNIFLLLILANSSLLFSQIEYNYNPIVLEKINKETYKKEVAKNIVEQVQKIESKQKKKIEKVFKDKYDYIATNIDSSEFYFDDTLNIYFQNILKNIQANNPILNRPEIKLYLSRATYPNASCLGEGSLIFNIGLLRYMENESQIAFVICHELAHYTQNHVQKATIDYYEKLYSKETQEKLRQLKNQQFETYTKAQELAKGFIYDSRKHSRLHESEADSLAYIYLKNTNYNENESFTALTLLDTTDTEKFTDSILLNTFFDFKEIPFNKSWIQEEKKFIFLKDTTSEAELDSLKTHPNCKKRVQLLSTGKHTNEKNGKQTFIQSENLFKKIIEYSDFECIQNRINYKNINGSLYLSLKMLKKYPNNKYLHKTVVYCFDKLIEGLKNHNLNAYIDLPSPFQEGDYKILLRFLNNIRISEAQKIKDSYTKKNIN